MSTSLSDLSLVQLRCFVAAVEAGSLAEAGRRLGMTVSGVSKTITRLEISAGVRLLHRSSHALSLTEAGEQLIAPARDALNGVARTEALLWELGASGSAGRVRVSAPTAFVRTCLMPILPALLAQHPLIRLDLRATDTIVDLAGAGVDLALRSGPLGGVPGHVALPWFRFAWVAGASPAYLARHGVPRTPADLSSHELIGFRNSRTGVVESWRLANTTAPVPAAAWRMVLDDAEAAWQAAIAGIGIAWAPDWLTAEALTAGTVVEVLQEWHGKPTSMSILRREGGPVPARVQAVMTFLRSYANKIPPRGSRDLPEPG